MHRIMLALVATGFVIPAGSVLADSRPFYRHGLPVVFGAIPGVSLIYPADTIVLRVGQPFSTTPAISGLSGGYTLAPLDPLPSEIALRTDGALDGLFQVPGTYGPYRIRVVDATNGRNATADTPRIVVLPQLQFAYPPVLAGITGATFQAAPLVWGGVGGTPTVSIVAGSLPAGLELSPATGAITGVPTQAGIRDVVFALSDPIDGSAILGGETRFSIDAPGPLAITAVSPPSGNAFEAYPPYAFTATGGRPPYAWTLTHGALPSGLDLATNGGLTGIPSQFGEFGITLRATDFDGRSVSSSYTLTIADAMIASAPVTLVRGTTGMAYPETAFSVIGAAPPVTWSASGTPVGLHVDPQTGILAGTPTESGSFPLEATAMDSLGRAATVSRSLSIDPPLEALAPELPTGLRASPYGSHPFTTAGGRAPITWTQTGRPGGMSFNNGVLSGTPNSAGTFTLLSTARDADNRTATVSTQLVIADQFTVATSSLPLASIGTSYSTQLATAGHDGGVTWTLNGGDPLPTGLSLAPSGLLSGVPNENRVSAFSVMATDANGSATANLTLNSGPGIALSGPSSLPRGTIGIGYPVQAFSYAGGREPVSLTATNVPPGMSFSNGFLSGTPTATRNVSMRFRAQDTDGRRSEFFRTIVIDAALGLADAVLPSGLEGTPYPSRQIQAFGGRAPYSYLAGSGTLPQGMSLSPEGLLSGTPQVGGTYAVSVAVEDVDGRSAIGTMTLRIDNPAVTIAVSGSPPSAIPLGGTVSVSPFSASGGEGPHSYFLFAGQLPPGISLAQNGAISGVPVNIGMWTYSVGATDALGRSGAAGPFVMQVTGGATMTGSLPGNTAVGQAYGSQFFITPQPTSGTFYARRRTGPDSWAELGSNPLPGITINAANGVISGSPTTAGTFSGIEIWHTSGIAMGPFTVQVAP